MWAKILVVAVKEIIDNLRDRRSLLLALVYPLMGPILLGTLVSMITGQVVDNVARQLVFTVDGGERAPDLIRYLEGRNVTVKPAHTDPRQMVQKGLSDSVLVIADDYADAFEQEQTAKVQVVIDSSRIAGLVSMSRVMEFLGDYNSQVAADRLGGRGIDPQVAVPVRIENVNVASRGNLTDMFLFMVPPFIIFTVFMGGVYLAIDTTSGERERGSLEPLLINPVPRSGLMLGKFLAALAFTAIAVIVQLIAFKVMFVLVGDRGAGFGQHFGLLQMVWLFAVALPLMMLAVAIQVIIAVITRSFKEAQTYLGLLPLVPALPGLALVFVPVQAKAWMMAIPGFSQTLLFGQVVRGEDPSYALALLSMAVTSLLAGALVVLAARLYQREELVFGG